MASKKTARLEIGNRLLTLLECFTFDKPEWGVTELSERLGLYKSVVHRMLVTLESRGFVSQDPATKKYRLGIKVFELGMVVASQMDLRKVAKPVMEELAAKTGETVLLEVVDELQGLCIEKVESPQSMKCTSQVGKRVPLYAGAPTKVLMAYLPEEIIDKIIGQGLERFTEQTVVDPDELLRQLAVIRQQGYCISWGEMDIGSVGIACPIWNHEKRVVAALSIVGPEIRIRERVEEFLSYCRDAAEEISRQVGGL
ncbi:MAG: IclR family transcriptional regulator [Thermoanaerobacteraceae bacterium]|nr:IclR family transcriptional regulator [Thermoanaerobacteraceae bacterium]